MSGSSPESLAHAAGITVAWTDALGRKQRLAENTLLGLLDAMGLPSHDQASRHASRQRIDAQAQALPALITGDANESIVLPVVPRGMSFAILRDEHEQERKIAVEANGTIRAPAEIGYYTVTLASHRFTLAVAPKRCFGVGDALGIQKQRAWGLNAQVYALRHAHDGGLGDSRAVAELARAVAHAGGDAIALSPLHAVSPVRAHYSPYSPSHRGFLNWMHADPAELLGIPTLHDAIRQAGVAAEWERAQRASLIDWPAAYAMRRMIYRALYASFVHTTPVWRTDFSRFIREGGASLHDYAMIAARQADAAAHEQPTSWRQWKGDWRARESSSAKVFAETHADALDFEMFLQWLSARCWDRARKGAHAAGQRIGLICDVPVGFESGGAEAWAHRDQVLEGLELGAPADAFNPDGQRWGITSYSPWGLKAAGFRPFIELLRANMALAGGIRIDHIIGFHHLWVLPQGGASTAGGYIRLPLDDLLRLTALESWRHRCIVIGEDLGTVPAGLRDKLAERGVLGIDVLLFTRDEKGDFLPPRRWRTHAVATTTTHDLPPLAAWREGADIDQLAKAHGWNGDALQQHKQARNADVTRMDKLITSMPPPLPREGEAQPNSRYWTYLAQTPSPLVLIPLEDALGRKEQPNLPGTIDTHPNWRYRLPGDTSDMLPPVLHDIDTSLKGTMQA